MLKNILFAIFICGVTSTGFGQSHKTDKPLFFEAGAERTILSKDSSLVKFLGRASIIGDGFSFKNADSIIVEKNKKMFTVYNCKEIISKRKIITIKQSDLVSYFIYKQ